MICNTPKRLGVDHSTLTITFALLCCLGLPVQQVVHGLRRPMRSVKQCDPVDSRSNCETYCEETYFNPLNQGSVELMLSNKKLARSFKLETSEDQRPTANPTSPMDAHAAPGRATCCCVFEAPWPSFVSISSIRAFDNKVQPSSQRCRPLMVWFNLSTRTLQNRDILCKYYDKLVPLTMLELMQFAEAASYLNFLHPRHPSIMLVLSDKKVGRVDKDALKELRDNFFDNLLDTYQPIDKYDGYKLETNRFRAFLGLKKLLPSSYRSEIVKKAIDELVISNMMVDVAAAAIHVREAANWLNVTEVAEKDYDTYDNNLKPHFTVEGVNCVELSKILNKLGRYLNMMKAVSKALHEKLVYEQMKEKCPDLVQLLKFEQIFKNLLSVNCEPRGPASRVIKRVIKPGYPPK